MSHFLRSTLCLCLMVVLTVTSLALGVARGQAPADGQIVICSAHGSKIVWIDKDGQPTSAPQYCADCALSLIVAGPEPAARPTVHPVETRLIHARPAPLSVAHLVPEAHRARAPPLSV